MQHTAGKGVGYDKGYTSLQLSLSPQNCWGNSWLPFFDLRGHLFNDGRPAANAGIGIRYLSSITWGINGYYDYRRTKHFHYNQVGAGVEVLGSFWGVNLNGYLPVGKTKSSSFGAQNLSFFQGHHFFLQSTFKEEFAFKGLDTSATFRVAKKDFFTLNASAGPYYFHGKHGVYAVGGKANVTARFTDYLSFGLTGTYDNLFHARGEGIVALNIPLGPKKLHKRKCTQDLCSTPSFLNERISQGVHRNEIVVVDKKTHGDPVALIDPTTGEPFFFVFVDNGSSSNGTFESPYPTLLEAQNNSSPGNILYIFAGDGTSTGMDEGITLQDTQKLWGAGISHTLAATVGNVTIPAQGTGTPLLTNLGTPPTPTTVITCADNNEIAGMHVLVASTVPSGGSISTGISCLNSVGVNIHDNTVEFPDVADRFNGIELRETSGNAIVTSNVFEYVNASALGWGVQIATTTNFPDATYLISENQFTAPVGATSTGIEFGDGQAGEPIRTFDSITISNNQLTGLGLAGSGGKAMGGFGFGSGSSGRILIENNVFSQCGAQPGTVVLLRVRAQSNIVATVTNNRWENSQSLTDFSLEVFASSDTAITCLTLMNNISDVTPGTAYNLSGIVPGVLTTDVSGNTGTVTQTNTSAGTCP